MLICFKHLKVPGMNSPAIYKEFFVHAYLKKSADRNEVKLRAARENFSEKIRPSGE